MVAVVSVLQACRSVAHCPAQVPEQALSRVREPVQADSPEQVVAGCREACQAVARVLPVVALAA